MLTYFLTLIQGAAQGAVWPLVLLTAILLGIAVVTLVTAPQRGR